MKERRTSRRNETPKNIVAIEQGYCDVNVVVENWLSPMEGKTGKYPHILVVKPGYVMVRRTV